MRVLGLCCTKDSLDFAIVDGTDRQSATKVHQQKCAAPAAASRGADLVWVRKEVLSILDAHNVEGVVIRVAEVGGPGTSVSLGRAEVEGVVQEALATRGVRQVRVAAVDIRAAFAARNSSALESALTGLPVLQGVAASRKGPLIAALTEIPA